MTPADRIHLTLAFLGPVAPQKAVLAARRVQGRAHQIPIDQAQYWKHNGVVWVGPRELPPALKALVEALHFELYRAEYILERRPYAAHATLLRTQRAPGELAPLPAVDWPAAEFTLVSSSNSAKGSVYEVLERFPLREGTENRPV